MDASQVDQAEKPTKRDFRKRLLRWFIFLALLVAAEGLVMLVKSHQRQLAVIMILEDPAELHFHEVGPSWVRNILGQPLMRGFDRIYWIDTHGKGVSIKWLETLSELETLTHLSINTRSFDNSLLDKIPTLQNLRILDLINSEITDQGLISLKRFPNLTSLDLSDTKITDEGLRVIAEIKTLSSLELDRTKISDQGLESFKLHNNLEWLSLDETKVSGIGLKHCRNLEYLSLAGHHVYKAERSSVTDNGLASLQQLKQLKILNLSDTQLSDDFLRNLGDAKHLETLRLSGTMITGTGFQHLENSKTIESLHLNGCKISNEGLNQIGMLSSLTVLDLSRSPPGYRSTDRTGWISDLRPLLNLNHLKELELKNQAQVFDDDLSVLAKLKSLEKVTLRGTSITEGGLRSLSGHPNLRKIDVPFEINKQFMKELEKSWPSTRTP